MSRRDELEKVDASLRARVRGSSVGVGAQWEWELSGSGNAVGVGAQRESSARASLYGQCPLRAHSHCVPTPTLLPLGLTLPARTPTQTQIYFLQLIPPTRTQISSLEVVRTRGYFSHDGGTYPAAHFAL